MPVYHGGPKDSDGHHVDDDNDRSDYHRRRERAKRATDGDPDTTSDNDVSFDGGNDSSSSGSSGSSGGSGGSSSSSSGGSGSGSSRPTQNNWIKQGESSLGTPVWKNKKTGRTVATSKDPDAKNVSSDYGYSSPEGAWEKSSSGSNKWVNKATGEVKKQKYDPDIKNPNRKIQQNTLITNKGKVLRSSNKNWLKEQAKKRGGYVVSKGSSLGQADILRRQYNRSRVRTTKELNRSINNINRRNEELIRKQQQSQRKDKIIEVSPWKGGKQSISRPKSTQKSQSKSKIVSTNRKPTYMDTVYYKNKVTPENRIGTNVGAGYKNIKIKNKDIEKKIEQERKKVEKDFKILQNMNKPSPTKGKFGGDMITASKFSPSDDSGVFYASDKMQKFKYEIEKKGMKGKSTFEAIPLSLSYAGAGFAKGAILGVTAPLRPQFYMKEIPSTLKFAGGIFTGKTHQKLRKSGVAQSIRYDPFSTSQTAGEIVGFSKGLNTFVKGYKKYGGPRPTYENVGGTKVIGADYGFRGKGKALVKVPKTNIANVPKVLKTMNKKTGVGMAGGATSLVSTDNFIQPKTGAGTDYFMKNIDKFIRKETDMLVEGKKISPKLQKEYAKKGILASREQALTKAPSVRPKDFIKGGTSKLTESEVKASLKSNKGKGRIFGSSSSRPQLKSDLR